MKKIYSYVLMVATLLIGTNAWATIHYASSADEFDAKWKIAGNGDTIQLTNSFTANGMYWLGTDSMHATANDPALSLTLDLNGKKLTASNKDLFVITHGALRITTGAIPGGKIEQDPNGSCSTLILITGSTFKDCNPKDDDTYYSHLYVEKGVTLRAEKQTAISIGDVSQDGAITNTPNAIKAGAGEATGHKVCYDTNVYKDRTNVTRSVSNGVRVDLNDSVIGNKYAVKINGYVRGPKEFLDDDGNINVKPEENPLNRSANFGVKKGGKYPTTPDHPFPTADDSDKYSILATDVNYSPYIHIAKTAVLRANANGYGDKAAIALYAAGYARWLVEGDCAASVGLNIKSGEVEINDANIASLYNDTREIAATTTSGSTAKGSAIVIESTASWTGDVNVIISGDTKVTATHGYAIEEGITNAEDTKVEHLTITGGTFEGGDVRTQADIDNNVPQTSGAILISKTTATSAADPNKTTTITITGGQIKVDGESKDSIGTQSLEQYLAGQSGEDTHVTYVDNGQGGTTMVISKGAAPEPGNKISNQTTGASVKWVGATYVTDMISSNLKLTELEINDTITADEADADALLPEPLGITAGDPRSQTLTIANDATLEVGRVILGPRAKIIVEAGGKLIVTGTQGIVSKKDTNIVLRTAGSTQAEFLFNPAVTSNRHPNATVEMKTTAGKLIANEVEYREWHRFAVPVESIVEFGKSLNWSTYLYAWSYEDDDWYKPSAPLTIMKPFEGYTLSPVNDYGEITYTFKGQLVGNDNHDLKFVKEGFNFFGNSYTAFMSVEKLIDQLTDSEFEPTVWTWYSNHYHAVPLKALAENPDAFNDNQTQIKPMQTFILRLVDANEAETELNYSSAIWGNPRYADYTTNETPNEAPARSIASNDNTFMRISINAGEENADDVMFMEQNKFSDAIDKGYDASKFMNEQGVNIYATVDGEEFSAVATDNVEGKTLSVRTANEAIYTLSFSNVNGAEYAIRDNATNAIIAIEEGATYEFAAQPNSVIENRFEIVNVNKMPTVIDNTEVKANVKGIYTITGQYVGENFEILPAGVYVVNGIKIVK